MEYASKENGDDTNSLKKLSLLTSLVNDNKETFGLTFPSVKEQIANKQRIERELLKKELTGKEEKLSKQATLIEEKESELSQNKRELEDIITRQTILQNDIEKYEVNRKANIELNKSLAEQRDKKHEIITKLEGETKQSKKIFFELKSDVNAKQGAIDSLNERVSQMEKENSQHIERIKELTTSKDADITKLRIELERNAITLSTIINDNNIFSFA